MPATRRHRVPWLLPSVRHGSPWRPPEPVPGSRGPRRDNREATRTAAGLPPNGELPLPCCAPVGTPALLVPFPPPAPAVFATRPDWHEAWLTRPPRRAPGSRPHVRHVSAPVLRTQPGVPTHTRGSSPGDTGVVHPCRVQAVAAGFSR